MAPEINQTVFAGGDFLLELLVGETGEKFVGAVDVLLPGAEGGIDEGVFGGHRVPFWGDAFNSFVILSGVSSLALRVNLLSRRTPMPITPAGCRGLRLRQTFTT